MKSLLRVRCDDRQYQFGAALVVYEIAAVSALLGLYIVIGANDMACVTLVSELLSITCYYLFKEKRTKTANAIGLTLIIYTSFTGDYILGWNAGYHFYVLCIVPLIVTSESLSKWIKAAFLPLLTFLYIYMKLIITQRSPMLTLPLPFNDIIGDVNMILAIGCIAFAMFWYSSAAVENEKKLKKTTGQMMRLANTDQLTGLPNRRELYRGINRAMNRLGKSYDKMVVGMADIDDFKKVNDTYGHLCGDEVLIKVSDQIRNSLRKNDVVGRWGGEEFLIILPDTSLEQGKEIIERIQHSLNHDVAVDGVRPINVTMTIGVVECLVGCTLNELIRQIDDNLFTGKRSGKNCIIGHSLHGFQ